MKFLRKMNRGFLLLIVCILVAVIYLVVCGVIQSKDKKEVVALCDKYIQVELSYSILPEQYRENPTSMPTEEVQKYLDNMKKDITSYYVGNKVSYSAKLSELGLNFMSLLQGQTSVTQYEKIVQKYTDITFKDDKCTLTAQSLTTYNGEQNMTSDVFALQKIKGKWKITSDTLITKPADTSSTSTSTTSSY